MANTVIREVSVYRNGCIVKRTGKVYLKQGTQQIRLEGLRSSVDDSSLRLNVPEGVVGSNVQIEYQTAEKQKEALKELSAKIAEVRQAIENKKKLAALWEANADFSQKDSVAIDEMTRYLEKLPERLEETGKAVRELEEEKKRLDEEYKKAGEKEALPYVLAELSAPAEGEYPVELIYRDYQASWYPVYEIHAEDDKGSLKLRMRAKVTQNSGENWENVALKLFTGNPSVSGTIPELSPSHIRFYEPVRYDNARAGRGLMKTARMDADAEMVMEEAVPMMAMGAMNAVIAGGGTTTQNETMTEYALTGSWDIRDGQEILCDIRTDELPCRYHVVAVPKLSDDAYLAAEVKTADLEEMQDTEASVYLKGAFAGNVVLEPDMTKDVYDLSLGVDETVKVKRTQKRRHTSQVLLKGQKKTEYEYETVISSRKEKEVSVTVTDQIPVSDEKTIVVEAVQLSEAEQEKDNGILHWNFTLPAGGTKTLTLSYTVAWPKDKQTQER